MTALALALLLSASPADVPLDKVAHASVSANLTLGVSAVAHLLGAKHPLLIGIVTALTVGLLKELVWDLALGRGSPEVLDVVANVLGVTSGALVAVAFSVPF